jgi:hypothetical protein
MASQVYSSYHPDKTHEHIAISCTTQAGESEPDGYPVLCIGPITIFPSPDQLLQIHHAITTWLDAESERLARVAEVKPPKPEEAVLADLPGWTTL